MKAEDFKEKVLGVMLDINDEFPTGWNSDEVYREAELRGLDTKRIGIYLPNLFKTLKSMGIIEKSNQFRLSRRKGNSSSPLPLWKRVDN